MSNTQGAPILRVGKIKRTGKTTPRSVMGHLARTRRTKNADASRTPLNVWLKGHPGDDLGASIQRVMEKAGIDPAKVRKDATLANDIMLSVSPEWFRPDNPSARGTYSEERLAAFREEAEKLLAGYGARVVTAVLHLDESTPHIQAVIVPILKKKDGPGFRLSGKDLFNPPALEALQQKWEDQMSNHGVGPRIKKSTARHNPIKRYYAALESAAKNDPVPGLKISDPPAKGLLESSKAHSAKLLTWKEGQEKALKKKLKTLSVEASRGRLYEAERRSAEQLVGILHERHGEIHQLETEVASTRRELELTKEQVAALRAAPLNKVVAMLGYTGVVAPRENAIDVVRRVGELDYKGAVAWLAQRFGTDLAAAAVREAAVNKIEEAAAGPAVFTKAEKTKRLLVSRQLDALAAPSYRITLMRTDEDGKKIGRNLGKGRAGAPERTFSKAEVLEMIPQMTAANHGGSNVFITPIDPDTHHVLVDDVKPESLQALQERGYAPCLVLETSPQNHQVILKIPHGEATPRDAANEAFKDLNRDLGDQHITGLVHPVRLAGFENRKEKHRTANGYPFVGLGVAVNRLCRRAMALVQSYASPTISGPRHGL